MHITTWCTRLEVVLDSLLSRTSICSTIVLYESNCGIQRGHSMCCRMPPAERLLICEGYDQVQNDGVVKGRKCMGYVGRQVCVVSCALTEAPNMTLIVLVYHSFSLSAHTTASPR